MKSTLAIKYNFVLRENLFASLIKMFTLKQILMKIQLFKFNL